MRVSQIWVVMMTWWCYWHVPGVQWPVVSVRCDVTIIMSTAGCGQQEESAERTQSTWRYTAARHAAPAASRPETAGTSSQVLTVTLLFLEKFNHFFRLSHMGSERLLQDWILCQLHEEELQENMQTVLTLLPEYSRKYLYKLCSWCVLCLFVF